MVIFASRDQKLRLFPVQKSPAPKIWRFFRSGITCREKSGTISDPEKLSAKNLGVFLKQKWTESNSPSFSDPEKPPDFWRELFPDQKWVQILEI